MKAPWTIIREQGPTAEEALFLQGDCGALVAKQSDVVPVEERNEVEDHQALQCARRARRRGGFAVHLENGTVLPVGSNGRDTVGSLKHSLEIYHCESSPGPDMSGSQAAPAEGACADCVHALACLLSVNPAPPMMCAHVRPRPGGLGYLRAL